MESEAKKGPSEIPETVAQETISSLGHHPSKYTARESNVMRALVEAWEGSSLSVAQRLHAFARHVRRQDVARFLARYELFKLALPVCGSIVECGVFTGQGIMSWLHFSAILEPYNHSRRIVGFDTFAGFAGIHDEDLKFGTSSHLHDGAFRTHASIKSEIEHLAAIHDQNRPLGHIGKVELVAGDARQTIRQYLDQHPHLLISMLYLDFDLYEPTKAALELLMGRVVRGGVIAFDEPNCPEFPGETTALLDTIDISKAELRRFPFEPYISYLVRT